MLLQQRIKLIKKLEYLVAFQEDCLNQGNWDDYDRLENIIKKIEEELLHVHSQIQKNTLKI